MSTNIIGWNGEILGVATSKGENPMLVHGYGPASKHCSDCCHLLRNRHHDQVYYKCELYKLSHGSASDFRKKWPACKKFEQETTPRETIYTE